MQTTIIFLLPAITVTCTYLPLPPRNASSILSEEEELAYLIYERCPSLKRMSRPVTKYMDKIRIGVRFQNVKFNGIDDTLQRISITGFLIVQWNLTECPAWKQDPNWGHVWRFRPIDFSSTGTYPMWFPVVWQPNGAENVFTVDDIAGSNRFVRHYVDHRGRAGYDAVGKYTANCDLAANLTRFPFDTVVCNLEFQAWSPTDLVIGINQGFPAAFFDPVTGASSRVPQDFISVADVWELQDLYTKISEVPYGTSNYTRFTYAYVLKRRSTSYILTIFVPTFALFIMLIGSFFIPAHDSARPTFSLSIVMTYFLLQAIVDQKLPLSSEPIYASLYLTGLLWLGTGLTVYFSVMNHLGAKEKWQSKTYTSSGFGPIKIYAAIDLAFFVISILVTLTIHGVIFFTMVLA